MSKAVLSNIIVELHVPDFQPVKDFYGNLGFKVVWERSPKDQAGYLVIKRGDSILSFFCGNEEVYNHSYFKKFSQDTVRGYGVEIAIYVTDKNIDEYYQEVISRLDQNHIAQELKTQPWGGKDFRLIDPFGYYLCIREENSILEE